MENCINLRISLHAQANDLMRKDGHREALIILKKALKDLGPHITLLTDIAACYYMVGDFDRFCEQTKIADLELKKRISELSPETVIRASHSLGKFLEETAQISRIVPLFQSALERCRDQESPRLNSMLCQLLRIQANYGTLDETKKIYIQVERSMYQGKSFEVDAELALMYADLRLFGFEHAQNRIDKYLTSHTVRPSDRSLMVIDLMYEGLIRKAEKQFHQNLVDSLHYFELNAYEKIIYDTYEKVITDQTLSFDLSQTAEMSLADSIKIQRLILLRSELNDLHQAALTKLNLLLLHTDMLSRNMYLEGINTSQLVEKTTIKIIDSKNISVNGRSAITILPSEVKLIGLFSQSNHIDIETALMRLYQQELSVSHIEKLKTAVLRASKKLQIVTDVFPFFTFRKTGVTINQNVSIE